MRGSLAIFCFMAGMFLSSVPKAEAAYPFGVMPSNASESDCQTVYNSMKSRFFTSAGSDKLRMTNDNNSTYAEGMGFALIAAAAMKDENSFKKLWNYCKDNLTVLGVLPNELTNSMGYSGPADGNMDVAIGLDMAALSWPDAAEDWDWVAQKFIKTFKDIMVTDIDAIKGDINGYYLNYINFAALPRFEYRTGDEEWTNEIATGCYKIFAYSYTNYTLPMWYVDAEGVMADPGDEWDSNPDRFDNGPTRVAYRVPFHYLVSGDQRSRLWAQKMHTFFKSKMSNNDVGTLRNCYKPSNGDDCGSRTSNMSTVVGGAGVCAMAADDQTMAEKAYTFIKNDDENKYMNHSVRMMCMLIMSGLWHMESKETGKYPPRVSAITPASGSVVEDEDVAISLTMIKGYAEIDKVELYAKDAKSGTESKLTTMTDNNFSWTWTDAPRGLQTLKVKAFDVDGRESDPFESILLLGPWYEVRPFSGTAPQLDGGTTTIEAEDFDFGGEGLAYHDGDPLVNRTGHYRPNEGVDVKDPGSGINYLAYTNPGPEWTEYTVQAVGSGTWKMTIHASSGMSDGTGMQFTIFVDDVEVGTIPFTPTGDWWKTAGFTLASVPMDAGYHRIRILNSGGINIDKFELQGISVHAKAAVPAAEITPSILQDSQEIIVTATQSIRHLTLANAIGQHVRVQAFPSTSRAALSLEGLKRGAYFVILQLEDGTRNVTKIVHR